MVACVACWSARRLMLVGPCAREVKYSEDSQGNLEVTGLVLGESTRTWEVSADAYVAALDVPGAQKLIPQPWRRLPIFDNIYKLTGVPVITVQLRYLSLAIYC